MKPAQKLPGLWLLLALLASACGGEQAANADNESSVATGLRKPMDKAAAVEQQLKDQKDRVDAAIDDAGSGNPPPQR